MIVVYDFVDISSIPFPLTIGRSYNVVSQDSIGYRIINDDGEPLFYSKHRFLELSLYRNNKLNQLINE